MKFANSKHEGAHENFDEKHLVKIHITYRKEWFVETEKESEWEIREKCDWPFDGYLNFGQNV